MYTGGGSQKNPVENETISLVLSAKKEGMDRPGLEDDYPPDGGS